MRSFDPHLPPMVSPLSHSCPISILKWSNNRLPFGLLFALSHLISVTDKSPVEGKPILLPRPNPFSKQAYFITCLSGSESWFPAQTDLQVPFTKSWSRPENAFGLKSLYTKRTPDLRKSRSHLSPKLLSWQMHRPSLHVPLFLQGLFAAHGNESLHPHSGQTSAVLPKESAYVLNVPHFFFQPSPYDPFAQYFFLAYILQVFGLVGL